ncbi:hypothetical protein B0H17DRAFT_1134457 [Mycena rosella]|uniref:Uncharacterized protein n=1 Tax=Mycena rosella TaxID=1033263 RepID=A0AAD7GI58_MYCRO|nr:hypothetical protein B0H17DRAFT_1134457 [Mycena rosella]
MPSTENQAASHYREHSRQHNGWTVLSNGADGWCNDESGARGAEQDSASNRGLNTTKVHAVQLRINCVALRISCERLRVGSGAQGAMRRLGGAEITPGKQRDRGLQSIVVEECIGGRRRRIGHFSRIWEGGNHAIVHMPEGYQNSWPLVGRYEDSKSHDLQLPNKTVFPDEDGQCSDPHEVHGRASGAPRARFVMPRGRERARRRFRTAPRGTPLGVRDLAECMSRVAKRGQKNDWYRVQAKDCLSLEILNFPIMTACPGCPYYYMVASRLSDIR